MCECVFWGRHVVDCWGRVELSKSIYSNTLPIWTGPLDLCPVWVRFGCVFLFNVRTVGFTGHVSDAKWPADEAVSIFPPVTPVRECILLLLKLRSEHNRHRELVI